MKKTISVSLSAILAVLVFHLSIVKIYSGYMPQYFNIRKTIAVIIFLLLIRRGKIFLKDEYLSFNIILLMFCGAILYSAKQGQQYMNGYTPNSIIFAISIAEFALCMEYFHYMGTTKKVISIFTFLSFLYCVLADLMIVISPQKTVTEWGAVSYQYLLGDKFDITYLHIIMISLFCCSVKEWKWNKKHKIIFVLLSVWNIIIAFSVQCTTSILGWGSFVIFYFLRDKLNGVFKENWFCVAYLALCNTILLINSAILNIPVIKYVIENVFHESTTLTGRTRIYLEMYKLLKLNIWWGVGFHNNYEMSSAYTGAGDVQNGICDCLVSFGIVGTTLMVILLVIAMKKGGRKSSPAILALLFSFITISSVEITLRLLFCASIALVAFSWETDDENRGHNIIRKVGEIT